MKKILLIIAASAMLFSSASARYMAVNEDTGTKVPESSTHLPTTFY